MSIYIADYDPKWPGMFEAEAQRLRAALGGLVLRIDHIGSTAVPGLAAKPVIDVQIAVADLQPVESYGAPLKSLGYSYTTVPVFLFPPTCRVAPPASCTRARGRRR